MPERMILSGEKLNLHNLPFLIVSKNLFIHIYILFEYLLRSKVFFYTFNKKMFFNIILLLFFQEINLFSNNTFLFQ